MQNVAPINRFVVSGFGLVLAYVLLVVSFPLNTLIVILNGILTGCGFAVAIIFWRLIVDAIQGVRPYSDVRQMAISIVILWVVVGLSVTASIQLRSSGIETTPLVTTALARYGAIVAAVLQVTVPDYGLGVFYGRERKLLWGAMLTGVLAAALAIGMQVSEVFAA